MKFVIFLFCFFIFINLDAVISLLPVIIFLGILMLGSLFYWHFLKTEMAKSSVKVKRDDPLLYDNLDPAYREYFLQQAKQKKDSFKPSKPFDFNLDEVARDIEKNGALIIDKPWIE
ncbi:MAG: hypothetical protein NWQ54_08630, partial [Paraglaciecola sp.]|nr:hypothetical protein [Paraglaciecola sp.]